MCVLRLERCLAGRRGGFPCARGRRGRSVASAAGKAGAEEAGLGGHQRGLRRLGAWRLAGAPLPYGSNLAGQCFRADRPLEDDFRCMPGSW
ncbi:Hypothetical predicted protein [Podarcis lilfordi]|uniref:Uncharacterized protein n=1 Tax=Podarcis lilfordi TaxID=74358 RepID=A0AA35KU65_9SAUR|nr:Hypothetical predicted protein [Podarcis lilfordi]